MERKHSRGFTLVELLVVIGIIALLIAILLPTLSSARVSARQVACASNMRQIGAALNFYLNDNKSKFPYAQQGWGYTIHYGWPFVLHEYLETYDIWVCHEVNDEEYEWQGEPLHMWSGPLTHKFSYGWNALPLGTDQGMGNMPGDGPNRNVSQLNDPSRFIVATDVKGNSIASNLVVRPDVNFGWDLEPPAKRHKEGSNVLFADYHVEWDSFENLTTNDMGRWMLNGIWPPDLEDDESNP